ncbi:ribonuclease P protein subunit p30 [Linepithema humile]|uniref:ribonuclease P protein subunit p30 n=1 Tax=Linepithema humile TaxID=83485 RepID=UPI0006239721|nr:PREDICTED: ribonuclease P protein subunit p30 [Linepithema humile]
MDFEPCNGFFDLCINVSSENMNCLNDILLRSYQMGYRTVALNQTIDESIFDNDKKKKKKGEESKTVPNVIPEPIDVSKFSEKFGGKLCILNRLTFICSDSTKTHILGQCATMKKYNLYAIIPTRQDMLEFACSQLNTDLITIKPLTSGVKLNRKLYRLAVGRGLCFEVQYANMLLNQKTRIATIHLAHQFYMYRKSMNVIVSSGANNINLIRNPYDIINLGSILGLSEDKSKAAILNQCQLLLLKAERRTYGKAVFTVEFTEEPMEKDD